MRAFAQKPQTNSKTAFAKPATSQVRQDRAPNRRVIGNQAALRMFEANAIAKKETVAGPAAAGFESERTPVHASEAVSEKSVEGGAQNFVDDFAVEYAVAEKDGGVDAGPTPAPAPAPTPVKAKKAGVDSFEVKWTKNASATLASSPTAPRLRLDYTAKFKKDADHDPALAEFRQSVKTTYEITAGPNKGQKGDTSPMHDDNYSRADDSAGRAITDVDFTANDNPGLPGIDKDDVLNYSFTAQQTIIDASDSNKVIATRGPHTGTIKGKDPRTFGGVPKTLSS